MLSQNIKRINLPRQNILAAFLIFVIIGGGSSVAIRITYTELDPFWVASSRLALGASAFWMLVVYKRIPFPKGKALIGALIFGTLTMGLAYILIAWGLVVTPASLFQILMAFVPLITIFLATFQGIEAITGRGIFGALLALTGIAIAVGGVSSSNLSLPHIAAIIMAAIIMAEGGVIIKKFPPTPPIMINAIGTTTGAVILGTISLVNGEEWILPSHTDTWIAFIYLIVFVTLIAFMLYLFVLNNWTASGTSYGFVLFPLVTVILAVLLAGESITFDFILGAAFVLTGVLVGAILPSKVKTTAIEECKARSGQVLPRCI